MRRRARTRAVLACTSIPALLNTCPVIQTARGQPGNAAPPATARQNEHTHRRVHLIYKTPPDTHSKHKPHVGWRARPPRTDQHNNTRRQRRASAHARAHPARHMLPDALPVSTRCVPAHLVPPGSMCTSSQPHADGGPAFCVGTTSPPVLSSSPLMAVPKAGAGRCPQRVLGDLLLPGVVGVAGIPHPWSEGHLLQQPPGIRAPCPTMLPVPGVTTGVRDISEEAAGA